MDTDEQSHGVDNLLRDRASDRGAAHVLSSAAGGVLVALVAGMTTIMEIFQGHIRGSAGLRVVEILGDGVAGRAACFECLGTGDWPFGPTPAECGPCVDCKGTGRILVSI
jgi:hypothetical protein